MELGRKVEHDERSKEFAVPRRLAPTKSVQHPTFGATLNQGDVGACTGFGACHVMNTGHLRAKLEERGQEVLNNKHALDIYSAATKLDAWPGSYPPDDTGSSGLAAMKALKSYGLITKYTWAFGIDAVLSTIATSPMLVGTDWYESMYRPSKTGLVKISGSVVGGHAYALTGYQIVGKTVSNNLFWFRNSWGLNWGNIGGFCMTVKSFEKLLNNQGDAVVPII